MHRSNTYKVYRVIEYFTSKCTAMEMLFTNNDPCEDNVICQVALLLYAMKTVLLMNQKYKVPVH
jgi:hypothetical protein